MSACKLYPSATATLELTAKLEESSRKEMNDINRFNTSNVNHKILSPNSETRIVNLKKNKTIIKFFLLY